MLGPSKKLFIYSVSAFFLILTSISFSFASPPTTPESNRVSESSRTEGTQKDKKSEPTQTETDKLSTSIKELSTAIRDTNARTPDEHEKEKIQIERKALKADEKIADETEKLAIYTDNIAGLTKLLVVVGAVQLVVFGCQLWLMRRATMDAGKSAQAALETAKSITASERAYVFAKVADAAHAYNESDMSTRFDITVKFINYGKTPAMPNRCRWAAQEAVQMPQTPGLLPEDVPYWQDGLTIAAGKSMELKIGATVSWSNLQELGKARNLYCFGILEYKDIFENTHETGFCWHYNPDSIRPGRFEISLASPLNYRT